MKRITFGTLAVAALLAGCNHNVRQQATVSTTLLEDTKHLTAIDEQGEALFLETDYTIDWPVAGQLDDAVMRSLAFACFGDSTATSPQSAIARWEQVDGHPWQQADAFGEETTYSERRLTVVCRQDSNLLDFNINHYLNDVGAAHGYYSSQDLVVDLATGRVLTLPDLLDTNLAGQVIVRAIRELDTNRYLLDEDLIFDESLASGRLPVPQTFSIDSTRSNIVVSYGLYEVAPYSSGIISVVLPVGWLNRQLPLTGYARQLLKIE